MQSSESSLVKKEPPLVVAEGSLFISSKNTLHLNDNRKMQEREGEVREMAGNQLDVGYSIIHFDG